MTTSSMTSQGGFKVGPLYSFINEIITFFMITKQRAKISSLNFLCVCIIRLYEYIFMTSLIMSPGHKIGQILKLIYLRQYLSYSVDQKLKMSEMLMAIVLVYSISGITSGKKFVVSSKRRPFWKFWNIKHSFNLTSDMKRSSQIMSKKVFFYGDDVINDVTGWPHSFSLYSCLGEVGSGSKLHWQCLVNKCQYRNCLSRLYIPKDDLNELHFSRLQVKGQHHRLTRGPWH